MSELHAAGTADPEVAMTRMSNAPGRNWLARSAISQYI